MPGEPLPDGWIRITEPRIESSDWCVMLDDGRVLRMVEPVEGEAVAPSIFDPATGLWTESAPQHHAKVCDRTVVVTAEGWVHVSGGMSEAEHEPIAACELLKPATGAWYEMPPLPARSYLHASVVVRGRVYVIGGTTPDGSGLRGLRTLASWAPGEAAWTMLPEMPFAISGIEACVLDDDSIVVWGYALESSSLRWDHVRWTELDAIDNGSAVVAIDGGFLSIGGKRAEEAHDLVRSWTPDGGWRARRDLPEPRNAACALRLRDGRVAVIGGTQSARRWEDTSTGGELDIEYRSFRREMVYDVPVRALFVETSDGWATRPSPTLWGPDAFVLPDGRVFVHDIAGSYLWTP